MFGKSKPEKRSHPEREFDMDAIVKAEIVFDSGAILTIEVDRPVADRLLVSVQRWLVNKGEVSTRFDLSREGQDTLVIDCKRICAIRVSDL